MKTRSAVYAVEYGIERPDGTRVIVSANAAPLGDKERFLGAVASFTDITEKKLQEQQVEDARVFAESIIIPTGPSVPRYLRQHPPLN